MPNRPVNRPANEKGALNARQMAFVNFYVIDFNATQAVLKAGYSAKGASQTGSTLLTNPKVKREIEKRKAALAARSEVSRDWLVHELAAEFSAAREGVEHLDKEGNVVRITRKPEAVVRIGELIARMHGWIDDKPGNTNQTLVNFVVQR
jgi:phage terminase small subunit